MEALLERIEVQPVGGRQDDFTVDDATGRQLGGHGADQLGEVAGHRPFVTAAELHLDGGKLKRLMGAKVTSGKPAAAFVEFLTPRAISVPECTIELEGRRGMVRIQLKDASASDLAGLSRALWEVAS